MLNALLDLILKLTFFIIGLILKLIMALFPKFTLVDQFATLTNSFFELIDGASAMTYFLLGDLTPALVTFALGLFTTKHLVLPIINFTRKVLVK